MRDKTLAGGLVITAVGVLLLTAVWLLFLQPARTPINPATAIPVSVEGNGGLYTIFEIVPELSSVTFSLDETLRGLPTTAVGSSHQVAGQVAVDFSNPAASQIGPIVINARTLQTDNEFRNNAIHGFILDTEAHEFITFTPTKISDLPKEFIPDEPVIVQIEGDLTIRELTRPVTFTATITPNGRSQLTGAATAHILRSDFDLQIPNAPGVANVSQEVKLTINFVARLKE